MKEKKKKEEIELKTDFDSLVRETMLNLSLSNAEESMEFLGEYYNELMGA